MMQMHPYILNVNEDAQLSGVVKLFIQEGESECRSRSVYLSDGGAGSGSPRCSVCRICFALPGEWDIGLGDSSPRSVSIKGLG